MVKVRRAVNGVVTEREVDAADLLNEDLLNEYGTTDPVEIELHNFCRELRRVSDARQVEYVRMCRDLADKAVIDDDAGAKAKAKSFKEEIKAANPYPALPDSLTLTKTERVLSAIKFWRYDNVNEITDKVNAIYPEYNLDPKRFLQ